MDLQSEFRHARAVRRERRAPVSVPTPSELWSADYGSPISAGACAARGSFEKRGKRNIIERFFNKFKQFRRVATPTFH